MNSVSNNPGSALHTSAIQSGYEDSSQMMGKLFLWMQDLSV